MFLSQSVHDFNWIKSSIFGNSSRDDFKSLGERIDDQLLFSLDWSSMMSKVSRQFHFNGTSPSYDGWEFHGSSDNHDRVIQGSFGFFDELFGTSSQDNCGGLGMGTLFKYIVSLDSDLFFFEFTTGSKVSRWKSVDGGLNHGARGGLESNHVIVGDTSSAENVTVSEILCGQVSNG